MLAPQSIEFGKNLLDIKRIRKGADIATVIIPLGAKLKDEEGQDTGKRLTIETVNDGVDFVQDADAIAQYGVIVKSVIFEDEADALTLKTKGQAYLADAVKLPETVELAAADMAAVGKDITSFHPGTKVRVTSKPHCIDQLFTVTKLSIDLFNPASNKLTLGGTTDSFSTAVQGLASQQQQILQAVEQTAKTQSEAIYNVEQNLQASINVAAENIQSTVAENYYLKEDTEALISSVSTTIEQTKNSFDIQFNQFSQDIEAVAAGADAELEEIRKYIRFVDGQILLGEVGVAVADTTTHQTTFGNMVQSKSKPKFTITASGALGSTIKTYKTEFEGKSYSGATPTASTITKSGTATAKITVTDSRGRTATVNKTWTVVAYSAPKIVSFQGFRCLADGTENYEGTYIKAAINFSIATVNNKNTASYTVDYKLTSATAWTALTSGSVYALNDSIVSADGVFGVDNSFDIRLTVKDSFATIRSTFEIPTAFTLLDFRSTGRGIAFGKVSENDAFECALPMMSSNGELINSPVILPTNQDLDLLIDPGYYVVGSTASSATILNKPPLTTTETALVEVISMGDGLQRLQRFTVCDKDDQYTWQRLYYSGTWGSWMLIAGCSGWKNLTIDAAYSAYSDNTVPRYRVNGSLVTVMGAVSPNTAYTSSASKVTIASGLPSYLSPSTPLAFVCQGSGLNRWTCGIETNGTITISRYGIAEFASVPTSAWLIFNCTYSI